MILDYRITISSEAGCIFLSPSSDCRILSGGLEGFDFPDIDVTASASGFDDGGFIGLQRISPRELSVRFELSDREKLIEVKNLIAKVMNPHNTCTIYTKLNGRKRKIDVVPVSVEEFKMGTFFDIPEIKLSFLAVDPFFADISMVRVDFPLKKQLFSFPLNIMKGAGTVCSIKQGKLGGVLRNDGDVPCGFRAIISAEHGAVSSPEISLGSHHLKVNFNVLEGSQVIVDTRRGMKNIYIDNVQKFVFSRESEFFSLQPGDNSIMISSDEGEDNIESYFEFTPMYFSA